jgi:hypothetical protein
VILGIFLGLAVWGIISLVFRPSLLTVFFCIWIASSVAKITEPKLVSQIGGGLGAAAGIHLAFARNFTIDNSSSFLEVFVGAFVGAIMLGFFFAVVGYFGAKILKKYEQGQGPFF